MARAAIARVRVERWDEERFKIHVHTARPGMVIGRRGADIEMLQEELAKKIGKPAKIEIKEIRQPDLEAYLVAEGVAAQLERRARYRDAMKRAVQNSMRSGAQGCKIMVSGRLGGNEIANSHYEIQGRGAAAYAARRHRLRVRGSKNNLRRHRRQGVDLPRRSDLRLCWTGQSTDVETALNGRPVKAPRRPRWSRPAARKRAFTMKGGFTC